MIIDDLHTIRVTLSPPEADSPPLVDSDTVLPFTITRQLLETVTWRDPKIRQLLGSIENQSLRRAALTISLGTRRAVSCMPLLGGDVSCHDLKPHCTVRIYFSRLVFRAK